MPRINLDQRRKARAAAREKNNAEPIVVEVGGQDFTLPAELPFEFADKAANGDLRGALSTLFDGDADAFFGQKLTFNDVMELVQEVASAYGFDNLPESKASAPSS